jgi:hypothetical protein
MDAKQATPATKVWQIISQLPTAFMEYLCQWSMKLSAPKEDSED